MDKAPDAFRTISEVAEDLDLPQHVLRFWESRFPQIKPMKRAGGRRYYRPDDVDLLRGIRHLLYGEGYTIRGVQRLLREDGVKFVQGVWVEGAEQPRPGALADLEAADTEVEIDEETEAEAEVIEDYAPPGSRLGGLLASLRPRPEPAGPRRDPPLHAAPVPRVTPLDRPGQIERPLSIDRGSPPAAPVAMSSLSRDGRRALQAVMHDLTECRRLLQAALDDRG